MRKIYYIALLIIFLAIILSSCGSNSTSARGRVYSAEGPVGGVKVVFKQVTPVKGYEYFEVVTDSRGDFKVKGLQPSSKYTIQIVAANWIYCQANKTVESVEEFETPLPGSELSWAKAWQLNCNVFLALSKDRKSVVNPTTGNPIYYFSDGGIVVDSHGKPRFSTTNDGTIIDSQTGLEWVIGPIRNVLMYAQARDWVESCSIGGGDWRIPTRKELATIWFKEFATIFPDRGKINMDANFKNLNGWLVWAELKDELKNERWFADFSAKGTSPLEMDGNYCIGNGCADDFQAVGVREAVIR